MRQREPRGVAAASALLVWSLVLSAPYWILGSNSYVRIHDNADSILPLKMAMRGMGLQALSRVSPLVVSGVDMWATDTTFNLDTLLFMLLPGWAAYGFLMLLQRFIAGYFMHRLLRDTFDVARAAAIWAGLAYALFFQPTIHSSWAGYTLFDGFMIPGLPMMLWLLWRFEHASTRTRLLSSSAVGLLLALSGPYAFAPFAFIILAGWTLCRSWRARTRVSIYACCAMGLGWLLGEAPSLLAARALSPVAHRTLMGEAEGFAQVISSSLGRMQLSLSASMMLLLLGVLGVAASLGGRRRTAILLLLATAGAILLVAVLPVVWWAARGGVSGGGFQADRMYLVVPAMSLLVSAFGVSELQRRGLEASPRSLTALLRWLPAVLVALVLWNAVGVARRMASEWEAGHRIAALVENETYAVLLEAREEFPDTRVATVADDMLRPSYATANDLPCADGYIGLYPASYHMVWREVVAGVRDRSPECRDYFDNWGNRVYLFLPEDLAESHISVADLYDMELLSLLGVRYIVANDELRHPWLNELPTGSDVRLYENMAAKGAAFVADSVVVMSTESELLELMGAEPLDELRSAVLVDKGTAERFGLGATSHVAGNGGSVEPMAGRGAFRAYRVSSREAGFLCVMVPFDLGWRATVDGADIPAFRTHVAFLAVPIEAGQHEVILRPESIVSGDR